MSVTKAFLETNPGRGVYYYCHDRTLDQEMMQKNISVNRLSDSQKNVMTMAVVKMGFLFLFPMLGGLLYLYAVSKGAVYTDVEMGGKIIKQLAHPSILTMPAMTINIIGDKIFPSVAINSLPPAISIIFIIALISALFPSVDGALTVSTSSFCIDLLNLKQRDDLDEKAKWRTRLTVQFTFAFVFLACIMVFYVVNNNSIIDVILDLAGYTYGLIARIVLIWHPSMRNINNTLTITGICLAAPVLFHFFSPTRKGPFWRVPNRH